MATLQMNFLSMSLGMQTNVTVFLPGFSPSPASAGKPYAEIYPRGERFRTLWLLGTETGYSKDRPGAAQGALVDEAVSDAVDHVLERVKSYWQTDMKQGLQYRLVIRVEGNFDADAIENVQMKLGDLIESSFEKSKENVLTAKTMDYNVWASRDEYSRSAKIYQMLKEKMAPVAKLRQININRKLLVLGLDNP